MLNKFALCFSLVFLALTGRGEIILPRILANGMVLQRQKPLPVWGNASPGEKITVRFKDQKKTTLTDASGNWKLFLDPLQASENPASLIISGSNTITLSDILVGEVWICSGQSNMEYTMRKNSKVKTKGEFNGTNPVTELDRASDQGIRIFLVNRKELAKPDPRHKGWSVAADSALRSFSAPGYFFAKELRSKLKVPVGMISSAVPGSAIEPWISVPAFAASSRFKNKKVGNDPGKFYEPMIRPLVPFAIKGFLWYQGETNCFLKETLQYTYKMETLINSWRSAWADNKLPFYYVQIAPFKYSESKGKVQLDRQSLPEFREAQAAALKIPNTAMIVTTDLVDDPGDLHPAYKWEIGRRLALLALNRSYKRNDVVATGPVYRKMKKSGNRIILQFNSEAALVSKDGKALSGFEIAGKDGRFVNATAVIKNGKVIVSSAEVNSPEAVRFAWDESARPNFYNNAGLPAQPFRTNNPLNYSYKYSGS